eukprot:1161773-Pelagomonas_calceolata.AAC.3
MPYCADRSVSCSMVPADPEVKQGRQECLHGASVRRCMAVQICIASCVLMFHFLHCCRASQIYSVTFALPQGIAAPVDPLSTKGQMGLGFSAPPPRSRGGGSSYAERELRRRG